MFLLLLFLFFNNIVDVVSLATMKDLHAVDLGQLINSLGKSRQCFLVILELIVFSQYCRIMNERLWQNSGEMSEGREFV